MYVFVCMCTCTCNTCQILSPIASSVHFSAFHCFQVVQVGMAEEMTPELAQLCYLLEMLTPSLYSLLTVLLYCGL